MAAAQNRMRCVAVTECTAALKATPVARNTAHETAWRIPTWLQSLRANKAILLTETKMSGTSSALMEASAVTITLVV